jgi:hypothetical protein
MHDMGYLSQVYNGPPVAFRDADGVVLSQQPFPNYVQKIRTPPLKGLRFNRFVTDSHKNTNKSCVSASDIPCEPGCDFLLHDGRACDAIEAAFLHDGPAIKKLGVIDGLNALTPTQLICGCARFCIHYETCRRLGWGRRGMSIASLASSTRTSLFAGADIICERRVRQ